MHGSPVIRVMSVVIRSNCSILAAPCSRQSLLIQNLALRQQLVVFKRHNPRPKLAAGDKFF
jgi:hypothetical protein